MQNKTKFASEYVHSLIKKDHFLCKIINKKFDYYHKCMFTGTDVYADVSVIYSEWEKIKIKELVTNDAKVIVSNFFKKTHFSKYNFFNAEIMFDE